MAHFPRNRTPVPKQGWIQIGIIVGFIIVILLVLIVHLGVGHNNGAEPISKKYYIKAQEEESWIEKFIYDPVATFTFVLTGATIGLYFATRRLWDATERLVKGADETAQRQLRAYVGIKEVFVSERDGAFQPIELTVKAKNFGSTPAIAYQIRYGWANRRAGHGKTPEELPFRFNPSTLMPSAIDETNIIRPPKVSIEPGVIWGTIIYRDVFGHHRHTDFRLISRMDSNKFTPDTSGNESS